MNRTLVAVIAFVAGWLAHAALNVALWLIALSGLVVIAALILHGRRSLRRPAPPIYRKTIWVNVK